MDFKQLQTFVELARCLHFGQAAKHLRIAQPHVSRRIRQLEEQLGVTLFLRDRRNVRLTDAGEVFLVEARNILRTAETAVEHTRQSAEGRRGRLSIGLTVAAMLGPVPRILGEFHRRSPDVHFSFEEMTHVALGSALHDGEADLAFTHPPLPDGTGLDQIMLEYEPLVAVLPHAHRLAQANRIALDALAADPWVMFPRENGPAIYDRIIALCLKAGFSPDIVQEAGAVHTRLGLVAAGFGVHLVDRAWMTMPYPGVAYVPVQPTTTIGLACFSRRDDPNPMLRNLLDIARRYAV